VRALCRVAYLREAVEEDATIEPRDIAKRCPDRATESLVMPPFTVAASKEETR
jgi:hypothetical protein